jgi:hypothetical protein
VNPAEIPQLIAQIGLADPRIQRQDAAERRGMIAMWAAILAEVPYEYALAAAQDHYKTSRYPILPADIATRWAANVRDRLSRHTDPTPAEADDDLAYRRQLAATRRAVALGQIPPAPHQAALGHPQRALTAAVGTIGRSGPPPEVRAAVRRRRPPAMSEPCPKCRARSGAQCTSGRGRTLGHLHPSRVDAHATSAVMCPTCNAATGQQCIGDDGHPYANGAHHARVEAARGLEAS